MALDANRRVLALAVLRKAALAEIPADVPDRERIAAAIVANVLAPWLDLWAITTAERDEAEAACVGVLPLIEAAIEAGPRDPGHAYMRARAVAMLAVAGGRVKPSEPKDGGG